MKKETGRGRANSYRSSIPPQSQDLWGKGEQVRAETFKGQDLRQTQSPSFRRPAHGTVWVAESQAGIVTDMNCTREPTGRPVNCTPRGQSSFWAKYIERHKWQIQRVYTEAGICGAELHLFIPFLFLCYYFVYNLLVFLDFTLFLLLFFLSCHLFLSFLYCIYIFLFAFLF